MDVGDPSNFIRIQNIYKNDFNKQALTERFLDGWIANKNK